MANAGGLENMGTSSAGSSFISTLVARMPYAYRLINNPEALNSRYEIFNQITSRRNERIEKMSVFQSGTELAAGGLIVNRDYHKFIYANIDLDKIRRLQDYRSMSRYAELSDCLDEICDEAIVTDDKGNMLTMEMRGEHERQIEDELQKEWKKFVTIFNLEDKAWEYIRQFLVEGELFFENVVSKTHPEYGILGVVRIPSELINPIYANIQNQEIKGFILRKPNTNPKRTIVGQVQEDLIPLDHNQVTYINSGIWNEDRTIRLPYLENSRRAYKQLSLIEDSIVIYRLVRAPERLVFYVDVGNMTPSKAEGYMRMMIQKFWSRKTFDTSGTGAARPTNVYEPVSMLDNYWIAKRSSTDGTKVESMAGGQNLGTLDDLMYFVKKLYKSLKVPIARLTPEDPFKDGAEITREELRFARFIMRIQAQIAYGLKNSFIAHLKLRHLWEQFKIREHHLVVRFNVPTNFMAVKEQQMLEMKMNNWTTMAANPFIAPTYAQRHYLGLTTAQLAENRTWLKNDAELQYELDQIRTSGPNWKKNMEAMNQAVGELGAAGGGGVAPGGNPLGNQSELPPEFGPMAGAPPAGGEAPAAGAPGAAAAGGAAPAAPAAKAPAPAG